MSSKQSHKRIELITMKCPECSGILDLNPHINDEFMICQYCGAKVFLNRTDPLAEEKLEYDLKLKLYELDRMHSLEMYKTMLDHHKKPEKPETEPAVIIVAGAFILFIVSMVVLLILSLG